MARKPKGGGIDLVSRIEAAFSKVSPNYKIHGSTISEILFIGTSNDAERELHRSPPHPGMPVLKHPAGWKQCSLPKALKQVERSHEAATELLSSIVAFHGTTISAMSETKSYTESIEKELEKFLFSLGETVLVLKKWEKSEFKFSGKGAPKKEIPFRIAMILGEEYFRATGRMPTISVDTINNGHAAKGIFLNLLRDVYSILEIDASAEAMGRKANALMKKREKAKKKLT